MTCLQKKLMKGGYSKSEIESLFLNTALLPFTYKMCAKSLNPLWFYELCSGHAKSTKWR